MSLFKFEFSNNYSFAWWWNRKWDTWLLGWRRWWRGLLFGLIRFWTFMLYLGLFNWVLTFAVFFLLVLATFSFPAWLSLWGRRWGTFMVLLLSRFVSVIAFSRRLTVLSIIGCFKTLTFLGVTLWVIVYSLSSHFWRRAPRVTFMSDCTHLARASWTFWRGRKLVAGNRACWRVVI